jgi:hypothetical protein
LFLRSVREQCDKGAIVGARTREDVVKQHRKAALAALVLFNGARDEAFPRSCWCFEMNVTSLKGYNILP